MRLDAPPAFGVAAQKSAELLKILHSRVRNLLRNLYGFAQTGNVGNRLTINCWCD